MSDEAKDQITDQPRGGMDQQPISTNTTHEEVPAEIDIDVTSQPRDILNQIAGSPDVDSLKEHSKDENSEQLSTDEVIKYKGVEIKGLQYLEEKGVLSREDVIKLLDQLPEGYFDKVHLETIIFEDFKYFTVERNGEIYEAREDEILPTDKISRRVRGQALWNSELRNGRNVISDGKQTVHVYSTLDWEGEDDKDVALYALAHELGHVTWNALDPAQGPNYWEQLKIPYDKKLPSYYIDAWKQDLHESQLPRYQGYKSDFTKEHGRHTEGGTMQESLEAVTLQEDFAIAHEYFLYWHNLKQLDSDRNGWLKDLYSDLGDNGTESSL